MYRNNSQPFVHRVKKKSKTVASTAAAAAVLVLYKLSTEFKTKDFQLSMKILQTYITTDN